MRQLSVLDQLICGMDVALRTLCVPKQRMRQRKNPASDIAAAELNENETRHVAGLIRVNHSGEVCAQALYQGQALTAKLPHVKAQMQQAADEEVDHLAWCEQRLNELNSHPSQLNLFWYTGSWLIGAVAGLLGDQWSLGFVAETERQVTAHLQHHLDHLPSHDKKSQAILTTMKADEMQHADMAKAAGAAELPRLIKQCMSVVSKLMTHTSYYI